MNLLSSAKPCSANRVVLIRRVLQEGWTIQAATAFIGISAHSTCRWLAHFKVEGSEGLRDCSSHSYRLSRSHKSTIQEPAARPSGRSSPLREWAYGLIRLSPDKRSHALSACLNYYNHHRTRFGPQQSAPVARLNNLVAIDS
ncbi:leucine zipper domain-containing protein [Geothrix oryzae]|uniref:leucine zipper domain-containing protein n=1 Tax=Geothrix oryzae TaxID=2927975 RepID=UPI0035CA3084